MAPIIASAGQTRSRLPPIWLHTVALKSAAPTAKPIDRIAAPRESPGRWSTHSLGADSDATMRSRSDSTTSTYVDTFAHRRRSRISDLTFVDHLDDSANTQITPSESPTSSLDDLSLTLINDDDTSLLADVPDCETRPTHDDDHSARCDDEDENHDHLAHRIDTLMAATMEALEASNRLVLDTLSSRAKLAQLSAMEAALDALLNAREAHLQRQVQAVNHMTEFISKTSAELSRLTSPPNGARITPGASTLTQLTTLADPVELEVRGAAATGIMQALDRDATIGKTAAKRLERMLQTPSPTSSPSSAASAQRRNGSRRAFSISSFAAVQPSIAEEHQQQPATPALTAPLPSSNHQASTAVTPSLAPSNAAAPTADSRTSTPQKKRSVSYDSHAPRAVKLVARFAAPTSATASEAVLAEAASTEDTNPTARQPASNGSNRPTMRPSLMATFRQESASARPSLSLTANVTVRQGGSKSAPPKSVSGLPNYGRSVSLKASADVAASSTAAESTLSALLGMPSAPSATSCIDTPSGSSYFDSAMEDSVSSASLPTPGSIHAIHGVLATPRKPTERSDARDGAHVPSAQESLAYRSSMQYSNLVSPRASLSLSDRDRAQQLSSQLAELRAERVTWNPQSTGNAQTSPTGTCSSGSGGGGGGALRALQKLNEMSAAKLAGYTRTNGEPTSSKRVSLGLGLPSFSALRPSATRSTSTTCPSTATCLPWPSSGGDVRTRIEVEAAASQSTQSGAKSSTGLDASNARAGADADADAMDTSSSLIAGGWRS